MAMIAHQHHRFKPETCQSYMHRLRRWVFHYFVGIHVLRISGQRYIVLNLTEEHLHLLQLLGKRYVWFYR